MSLPTSPHGLVVRIQYSPSCDLTSISDQELKSCFKPLQAEINLSWQEEPTMTHGTAAGMVLRGPQAGLACLPCRSGVAGCLWKGAEAALNLVRKGISTSIHLCHGHRIRAVAWNALRAGRCLLSRLQATACCCVTSGFLLNL